MWPQPAKGQAPAPRPLSCRPLRSSPCSQAAQAAFASAAEPTCPGARPMTISLTSGVRFSPAWAYHSRWTWRGSGSAGGARRDHGVHLGARKPGQRPSQAGGDYRPRAASLGLGPCDWSQFAIPYCQANGCPCGGTALGSGSGHQHTSGRRPCRQSRCRPLPHRRVRAHPRRLQRLWSSRQELGDGRGEAAGALLSHLRSGAALDLHLADRALLPLALACAPSTVTCEGVTRHLETNAWVIGQFGNRRRPDQGREGGLALVSVRPRVAAAAAPRRPA